MSRRSAANPVEKAIWLIETSAERTLGLAEIAAATGVSRFHLSHAFGLATGQSLMRYLRGRRLSAAARALAAGAPDILAVALEAGYGSHEAFTRAFGEQFGLTPEAVRARGHVDNLALVEPIQMDQSLIVTLEPPRFESRPAFRVAGLGQRYTFATNQGIPAQWQRFAPHVGHLPGEIGGATYGVCCEGRDDGSFEYVAGVEVTSFAGLETAFRRVEIPARRYVVFTHRGHVSGLRATVHTIWNQWLPGSPHTVSDAPNFERYDARFDARSGNGEVEIWVPITA